MSTISPNMNLVIPTVGVTDGPQYASDVDASLSIIDQHNHTAGNGVQIPPSGLNINSDLSFQANNATVLRSARFQAQLSAISNPTDLGAVYVLGVDLYFKDVNGNNIRLTESGGVAGTPGSIGGLASPASASYSGGSSTFIWQSNANQAAYMDAGPLRIRNISVSSNAVTLAPPAVIASDYSLTLPTLPAAQNFMTLDASGNMSAPWNVDNATIEINSNNLRVKPGSITTTQISATAGITGSQIAAATITSSNIANTTIIGGNIANSTIDNTKLITSQLVSPLVAGPYSFSGSLLLSTYTTAMTANRPAFVKFNSGTLSGDGIFKIYLSNNPNWLVASWDLSQFSNDLTVAFIPMNFLPPNSGPWTFWFYIEGSTGVSGSNTSYTIWQV